MMATDPVSAALIATNDPAFYNDTIRNMAAPWTNRDQSVFVPLNDYTATVIGMVRDNVPFNTLLSADLVYIGDGQSGEPAYSPTNNAMYQALDANNVDLQRRTWCRARSPPLDRHSGGRHRRRDDHARRGQRLLHQRHESGDVPLHDDESSVQRPADGHGHHPSAGSHPPGRDPQPGRRQHLVPDQLHRLPQRHGSDGAGLRLLQLQRRPIRPPTDTIGQIVYTAGQVQPKYHINNTNFPQGFNTPDDSWENRWRTGPNQILGWSATLPGSGNGAKSLGQELENSAAFASCQVTRVFKTCASRAEQSGRHHPGQFDDHLVPSAQLFVAASLRGSRRLLHGELSMNVTRIIGLLTLAASFALSACGGGGAADHRDRLPRPDQQRERLHRTRAGNRRRAGLRGQFLEQRARAEPLRPMPQRDHARRRCRTSRAATTSISPIRAGQHRGQSGAALDLADRHQGERRPQLLARRPQRLRRRS